MTGRNEGARAIKGWTEEEILAIDKLGDVGNCAITEYRFDRSKGAAFFRGGAVRRALKPGP